MLFVLGRFVYFGCGGFLWLGDLFSFEFCGFVILGLFFCLIWEAAVPPNLGCCSFFSNVAYTH